MASTISQEELTSGIFEPSLNDFVLPGFGYLSSLLEYREVKEKGIIKIISPKGWSPRRPTNQNIDYILNEQVRPIIQHVTQREAGVYCRLYEDGNKMTVAKYQEKAIANRTYIGDMDIQDMIDRFFDELPTRYPEYIIDHLGSLFDEEIAGINLKAGVNSTFKGHSMLPGISNSMLYFGSEATAFCVHKEDLDLHSINFLHCGSPKVWFSIKDCDVEKFEDVMKTAYKEEYKACQDFIRHKMYMLSPAYLKKNGITVQCTVQRAGDFVVTNPRGYHWGFNSGFNIAEAVNFGSREWLEHGLRATKCSCKESTNNVDLEWKIIFKNLGLVEAEDQAAAYVYEEMKKKDFVLALEYVKTAIDLTKKRQRTAADEDTLDWILNEGAKGNKAQRRRFAQVLAAAAQL